MMEREDKFLVIGAGGAIGSALADHFERQGRPVLRMFRKDLDFQADVSGWNVPASVTVAFVCAAITSISDCEKDPAGSRRVNVDSTLCVIRKLVQKGVFVVFFSTNSVFDGSIPYPKPSASVSPKTEYGRQKAQVEKALRQEYQDGHFCVIRLTKVVTPDTPLFAGWIHQLRHNAPIDAFTDLVMAPISRPFLVDAIDRIVRRRISGIVHLSADKDISYWDAGQYLAKKLQVDGNLVRAKKGGELNPLFRSWPARSALDNSRLNEEIGLISPDVWKMLDSVIRT